MLLKEAKARPVKTEVFKPKQCELPEAAWPRTHLAYAQAVRSEEQCK